MGDKASRPLESFCVHHIRMLPFIYSKCIYTYGVHVQGIGHELVNFSLTLKVKRMKINHKKAKIHMPEACFITQASVRGLYPLTDLVCSGRGATIGGGVSSSSSSSSLLDGEGSVPFFVACASLSATQTQTHKHKHTGEETGEFEDRLPMVQKLRQSESSEEERGTDRDGERESEWTQLVQASSGERRGANLRRRN